MLKIIHFNLEHKRDFLGIFFKHWIDFVTSCKIIEDWTVMQCQGGNYRLAWLLLRILHFICLQYSWISRSPSWTVKIRFSWQLCTCHALFTSYLLHPFLYFSWIFFVIDKNPKKSLEKNFLHCQFFSYCKNYRLVNSNC